MRDVTVYRVEYQRDGKWLPWSTERTREVAAAVAGRALAQWADAARVVEVVHRVPVPSEASDA